MRSTALTLTLSVLTALGSAFPAAKLAQRDTDASPSPSDVCAADSFGAICEPRNDSPERPIGDHINLDLLATGVFYSTGLSVALRKPWNFELTRLTWFQRDAEGVSDGKQYAVVTSHNGGVSQGNVGRAFAGEGQLPCELFDDNVGGNGTFDWVLTYYSGPECRYDRPEFCFPELVDVPPFEGPRSIFLKDNAEVCDRQ